jgi:hypothetical protein
MEEGQSLQQWLSKHSLPPQVKAGLHELGVVNVAELQDLDGDDISGLTNGLKKMEIKRLHKAMAAAGVGEAVLHWLVAFRCFLNVPIDFSEVPPQSPLVSSIPVATGTSL